MMAAVRQADSVHDFVHIRELLTGYLESAEAGVGAVASGVRAITTGFMDLDTLLTTGLKRGDLVFHNDDDIRADLRRLSRSPTPRASG